MNKQNKADIGIVRKEGELWVYNKVKETST